MNHSVNWAPEVHKYKGEYYMFATFTKPNGLRGTYILKSDTPDGEFKPHSDGAVTPWEWECLDGTLYKEDGKVYCVFCHEHTQIFDGTICFEIENKDKKKNENPVVKAFMPPVVHREQIQKAEISQEDLQKIHKCLKRVTHAETSPSFSEGDRNSIE